MLHMERRFTRFAVHIRYLSMYLRWFTPTLRVGFYPHKRTLAGCGVCAVGGGSRSSWLTLVAASITRDRRVRPVSPPNTLVVSRAALLFGGQGVSCFFSFPGFALSSFFGTSMGQLARDNFSGLVSGSLPCAAHCCLPSRFLLDVFSPTLGELFLVVGQDFQVVFLSAQGDVAEICPSAAALGDDDCPIYRGALGGVNGAAVAVIHDLART